MGVLDTEGSRLRAKGKIKEALAAFKKEMFSDDPLVKSNACYGLAGIFKDKAGQSGLLSWLHRTRYRHYVLEGAADTGCLPLSEHELAQYLYAKGKVEKAIEAIDRAIAKQHVLLDSEALKGSKELLNTELISFLFDKGNYLQSFSGFHQALDVLNKALQLSDQASHQNFQAIISNAILIIHLIRLDYPAAAKFIAARLSIVSPFAEPLHAQYIRISEFLKAKDLADLPSAPTYQRSFQETTYARLQQVQSIDELRNVRAGMLGEDLLSARRHLNLLLQKSLGGIRTQTEAARDLLKKTQEEHKNVNSVEYQFPKKNSLAEAVFKLSETLFRTCIAVFEECEKEVLSLSHKAYRASIANRIQWNFLEATRFSGLIAAGVGVLGVGIPSLVESFVLGIPVALVTGLVLYFVERHWVAPWIERFFLPIYKANLRGLFTHLSAWMYANYVTFLRISQIIEEQARGASRGSAPMHDEPG